MKHLRNERGIALLTAMLLTLIALGIIMAVLYMVTRGIELSAANKQYRTALEATHGGVEVFSKQILPEVFNGTAAGTLTTNFDTAHLDLAFPKYVCFQQKVGKLPAEWSECDTTSLFEPKVNPDATFTLAAVAGQASFNVYAKIVDTTPGNTDTSAVSLDSGAAVSGSPSGGITPMHAPNIYRIELQGERSTNPKEKANLTVLYAY